jgi:hypothetical protein
MHFLGWQTTMQVVFDVPPDNDEEGGNEPIDTNFEPGNGVDDDATMPWECLQPWDSTSEEAFNTDDEEENNNPNTELSTSSELVTAHELCFTPSDYAETKLLKLMNDAHAPHFLYQDVLNWAMEAKQLHYNFCPQCTTPRAQIRHIGKLAQLQYCCT